MYHPDKHKSEVTGLTQEGAKQYMQMINRAYEFLQEYFKRGQRDGGEERKRRRQKVRPGLVFLMSKRERLISFVHQHVTGAIQSKARTCSNQAALISALLDCVLTYLFNQGFSSEGQERKYIKAKKPSVAKNAVPAYVVPLSFLAKGERGQGREGGCLKRRPTWTFLSI